MSIKQPLFNYIENTQNILNPLNIDNGLNEIAQNIEKAELIVPVVGGFSAGKSTLINAFLGNELLPTDLNPETALATELRYSQEEYIEAVNDNEQVTRYELTQFNEIKDNAQNFKYLRVFLNNQNLAEIQPLVLVDMPGFDAPRENHNRAIVNYLAKGSYFIFLTSVEDGTITRSMSNEIDNLKLFSKDFSFCLSKVDRKPQSIVEQIKHHVEEQLKKQFDLNKNVILTSMKSGEPLKQILQEIDPEALMKSIFKPALKDNYFKNDETINTRISALESSREESDEAINVLQKTLKDIDVKKQNAISEVEQRYSKQSVEEIISEVSNSFVHQKEHFVNLALSDQEAFKRELEDFVKNKLLAEVKHHIDIASEDLIQDFKLTLAQLNQVKGFEFDDNFTQKVADGVELLLKQANSGLNYLHGKVSDKNNQNQSDTVRSIYRVVSTVLGITTSVVSPAIEVVLIFLPDIIAFFNKAAQERKMQEARNEVEKKLLTSILPELKARMRQNLNVSLQEQISSLISQISAEFEQQIAQKQAEIEKAVAEKEAKADELASQIEQLKTAKTELSTLAKGFIF